MAKHSPHFVKSYHIARAFMSEFSPPNSVFPPTIEAADARATRHIGRDLGQRLRAGDEVWLRGELGAGKTTFAQGIAEGIGVQTPVTSPTFVLIIEHDGPLPLLHLDAYRLENLDDWQLSEAGIFDFLARRDAVKLIEWPERIADFLPAPRFEVQIEHRENGRVLHISERQVERPTPRP